MGVCTGTQKHRVNRVEQMIHKNNMNQLLDQWPASFIYLLKQKFSSLVHLQGDLKNNVNKKHREGLDYEAFMKLFPRLKQQPQDIQLRAFSSFDIDKSQRVDFKEFCFVLSLILNSDSDQRSAFIFQLYDFDNDQVLSKQELKYFLKANYSCILQEKLIQKAKDELNISLDDSSKKDKKIVEGKKLNASFDKQQQINKLINEIFNINQQKKQKLQLKEFQTWMEEYFDLEKYFEIFELVPGPLKEREIIRQIMNNSGEQKSLSQQHYYVVSYKWWERWRFYINYKFAQNNKYKKTTANNQLMNQSLFFQERSIQYNQLAESQKPSNVSLVDLDLANSIPSEMKEDYSITKKIQKSNLNNYDQQVKDPLNGKLSPGNLMRDAKNNLLIDNQIKNQKEIKYDPDHELSPRFQIVQTDNKNQVLHKYSQSIPLQLNQANFQYDKLFDINEAVQMNDTTLPQQVVENSTLKQLISYPTFFQLNHSNLLKQNSQLQQIELQLASQDENQSKIQQEKQISIIKIHDNLNMQIQKQQPMVDFIDLNNEYEEIHQGDLVQGQQGQSKQPIKLISIKEEFMNIEASPDPQSPQVDPMRNPLIDCQVLQYGICETEENEQLNNNSLAIYNNEEGYQQSLRPGQIDNSDMQGEFEGELTLNILNNHDYVLIPEEAWNSLVQWYGISSQGYQVYKRKVFSDQKRKINILDMYPPVIKGFSTDNKGIIQYNKKVTLMVSARKTINDLYKKFKKRMKFGNPKNYSIYYKRIGEQWKEIISLETTLMELQIDTGCFVVFVGKKYVNAFRKEQFIQNLDFQKQDQDGLENSHKILTIPIRLGDFYDVQHLITNEWKLCHVCEIQQDGARFHIKKESYLNEFFLDSYEIAKRVERPGQKSRHNSLNTQLLQGQTPGYQNFSLNSNYPGLVNLGNTCFMNTILQCTMHTPLLKEYLLNQAYSDELVLRKKDSKLQSYLIVELADLINNVKNFKSIQKSSFSNVSYIEPQSFKKSIDIILPQFSGYEQHDAQEVKSITINQFLSLFLDAMSDELKKPQIQVESSHNSVIKELFMGKTINELQCSQCLHKSVKQEDFFTLSIPIPIQDEMNFEITYVQRCTRLIIPPLKKYGIKVSKYGTLKDFVQAFEKVSGLPHTRFDFLEVYRNNIHKPLFNIDQKTTIRHLGMKPYDELFAYEINKSPKDIEEESNALMALTPQKKQFVIDDYVDIQDQSGDWRYGQIKEIREKLPSNDIMYKIKIMFDKTEIINWYSSQRHVLAPYRTKALQKKNAQILHVVNRIYNPQTDGLEKFAIPFIITVPNWLTWREFRFLVYSQAKRFIDFSYFKKKAFSKLKDHKLHFSGHSNNFTFNDNEIEKYRAQKKRKDSYNKVRNIDLAQSVYLEQAIALLQVNDEADYNSVNPKKQDKKKSPDKSNHQRTFSHSVIQDELGFLNSPDFPYRLRLIDQSTNCCIMCDKIITYNSDKMKLLDKYCQGCECGLEDAPLNFNQPYNNQPNIALDWIDSLAFNPLSISSDHDASYTQLKQEEKQRKDRITLEECFNLLTAKEEFQFQCDHCKSIQPATAKFNLSQMPNILILHLKRFQFRDGYLEKIENDIDFPIKGLNLTQWVYNINQDGASKKEQDILYDLYAVANHMGNGQEGHYTSYVSVQNEGQDLWLSYDDDQVRVINKQKIMSQYTYLLFYKRREFSSSAIINLTFRSFDKNNR